MLLHTICAVNLVHAKEQGIPVTFELARFVKFIITEIFPGGRVPSVEMVKEKAVQGNFTLTREQSLQLHYAKTLDMWARALQQHKDEAIAVQSEEVYERYMKYLTGCAKLFRARQTDVVQFTLAKQAPQVTRPVRMGG
jgi:cyclopropane-fatty-acyl-phospholipid synthase